MQVFGVSASHLPSGSLAILLLSRLLATLPYQVVTDHCLLAVEARVRSLLANAVPAGAACKLNGKSRHV